MELRLFEENVTPDFKDKDILSIEVEGDTLYYNSIRNENNELVPSINELLLKHKDELLTLKDIEHSNVKGGRQKSITISSKDICDDTIRLFGNSTNEEVSNFYEILKDELLELINK